MTKASPPCWRMSRATASQAPVLRLEITTLAPSCAKASALARPMPRLEPVTIATLPSRRNGDLGAATSTRPSRVMALPIGVRKIFAQLLLGDGLAMDLIRTVGETQHPGARICISQMEILTDAGTATHLDGAVDNLLRHVRGNDLDHGDFSPRGLVADRVHHVGGMQGQQARLVDLDAGFCDPMARHAVVLEGAAFAEQYIRPRHPYVLEHDVSVAMWRVVVPEDAERALDLHARRIKRHQHHGLAPVTLGL